MRGHGTDVIVVGGGVVGCATAYFLAREGVSVRLLERDSVARHASGAAAGMLAPVSESEGVTPLLHWGLRSLALLPELCATLRDRSGIDPEYERSGVLRVALDEAEAEVLRARAASLADSGEDVELAWIDAHSARAAEPRLAPEAVGACWSPREGHVRSALLSRAYESAAAALGAVVECGVSVTGLVREGGRVTGVRCPDGERAAGHVVVCTGPWAAELLSWLGPGASELRLPVEPVRGQILSLEGPTPRIHSIVWGEEAYLVPKRDGSLVVGATVERVGYDCRVTVAGLQQLLGAAPRLIPELARASFVSGWAGLRPGSPDGLPAIGAVPGVERLFLAVGHGRNGVLLSPVTGEIVSAQVLGKGVDPDAAVFDPARWQHAG